MMESLAKRTKKSKNIEDIYPLSPMQQGMLFHTLSSPESGVYFEQLLCKLQGEINIWAFEKAWTRVVERHQALRTFVVWKNREGPIQVAVKQVSVPWTNIDWSSLEPGEQKEHLDAWLQADREKGFDLNKAPLLRFSLIRFGKNTYKLVWSFHHLLIDGWCLPIVFKEVLTFYEAINLGKELNLEKPRPYGDYIVWLQQQDISQGEQFWRKNLQGFIAPTPLGIDLLIRENVNQKEIYEERALKLSKEVTAALLSLARQHRITPNTIFQLAWALLLSRYSGEEDVVFGATVSGRPGSLSGVESMVGLFINTLPVRVKISGKTQLLPMLGRLQEQQVEREQYSYCRLVDIQGVSDVPGGVPLFESILVFENYPVDGSWLKSGKGDLEIDEIQAFERTNYPLTVVVGTWEELSIKISYKTSRLKSDIISSMLGHLQTLLESIVANPLGRVSELSLLTEAERHQILVEWNDTTTSYPSDKCIHELFSQQVERTPDAVAVVFEESQLTYQELNSRANQLAHYLRSLGVGPEVLVGICVERSIEMVVGLLSILKAGGAYVPLDPAYPPDRIAYMLSDARVTVLLTLSKLVSDLGSTDALVVCLDGDWGAIIDDKLDNPGNWVSPEALAYVIYTSGSTGQPKGVQISHSSLVNFLYYTCKNIGITNSDRMLALTTLSFDIAALEIYLPLLVGGKIILVSREVATDGYLLLSKLVSSQTTIMQGTPATWQMLLSTDWSGNGQLKMLCGGEALPQELGQKLLKKGGSLWNMYGPTETTVWSTIYQVTSSGQETCNSEPIGVAIGNTQVYILDNHLQPVPIGVPGGLYIGGVGLARGYLNRPELTADKFIPNPFSNEPGAGLYKTGDRARYRADGNIEFLGRIDNQVKIRGFRIELGEIEATLAQHPCILQAVVIAREDMPGDKRLVAYIVGKTEPPKVPELRDFLKGKLPGYMVPAAFVTLEAMPLTPNGKVDRRSLPAPDASELASTAIFVAPGTPTEELLAAIWCEVLGLKHVGIHDNFFELGGHSLLATQVISRIRRVFSVEVPVRYVFEFPTLATLSKAIEAQADSGWQAPAIVRVPRDAAIGLSFAQERLWFLNQLEGQSATYNMPGALRLDGKLASSALEQAITEIVRRHEALRTRFTNNMGTPVQIIAPAAPVTVPAIDLQDITKDQLAGVVQGLATEEAQRPFDLSGELLLRVKLLRLSAESHVLLLTMHHIVSDGWSIGVFCRELQTLYQAFAQGVASPLPELPIQYADFAIWQRQWLSGEVLDIQLEYWKQQLAGVPTLLELPTDRPRPPVQTFRGSRESFKLDEKLTDRLKQVSRGAGVTLFMTLLAAFATLLYRYSAQEDIVIGSPIANRNRSQIEPLIGFFVNTLALRIALDKNPSFAELLRTVRKVCLEAYGHQDLPFEVLVDALQPTRNLSHTPLFQVMFAMQNAPTVEPELPGLKCEMLEVDSGVAKFDITLSMAETSTGITGDIEYNSDLFDGARIRRMIGHFQRLLEANVRNPEARVDQLPLLTEQERHQLLVEWNDTATDYPSDKCIHHLFEEKVEKTPDAVAVVFKESQLTYRELNDRANQLAHYLRCLGVGPEVLVGLCVERSLDAIVAMVGIIKAGGAYVPIAPDYPQDRIAYILSDARVPVLITQSKLLANLPATRAVIVCLDTDWQAIGTCRRDNLKSEVKPTSLAYAIYTSGSTGKPKAVAVVQQAISRLVLETNYVQLQPTDCMAQASNISFDAATFEIWGALLHGAKLVGITKEVMLSPEALAKQLREQKITILFVTTALFNQLVSVVPDIFQHLSTLLFGGEAVDPSVVATVLEKGRPRRLLHLYGPTESTTFSTVYLVESVPAGATNLPIGSPISNTTIYVLDRDRQPVPIGISGELYIGGDGLARGYLNRSELTAARFIDNPFGSGRLYKTGDLVRYLPDGNIEFLGRIDNQVKIRGFRIELGEIEATLAQHPCILQAVVIAREDIPGDKRLVAYIVANREPPTVRELRDFALAKLPEYMVPAAFVTLEAMPLTPNGKVDRQSLPAPDPSFITSAETFVAPRTPTEKILAAIWSKILGSPRVGIHDNFFELGGDSILTIQIISQAARAGLKITPKQMFQHQTIASLAEVATVVKQTPKTAQQERVTGVVPLTPIQHWFFDQKLPEPHHYNQSVLLEVSPDTKPERWQQAVKQMNEHHDALRLRFLLDDGKIEQINASEEKTVPLREIDLSEVDEQQAVMEQTAEELHGSLNLCEGPLMQVALFNLGIDKPGRLLLVIHHLAVDGVSWRILLEDLVNAYRGNKLPEKTT
ncbi:MAG: amino acid adenylation domain-containing protein [Hormoscilla sp. GUM202]|nr:amino acid adenylation domain-containing protein [Hormoscilla sp. GUM202]